MPRARKTRTATPVRKTKTKPTKSIDDLVGYCDEGETIEVSDNFFDFVFMMYGESGAGKTSILAKVPGSYVIQCDPNRKGLSIRQTNIPNISLATMKENRGEFTPWDVINATFEKIIADDSVSCVIVDNLNLMYQHATNHYCLKNSYNKLQDANDFGHSWNMVDRMYVDWFSAVVNAGKGLGIITHMREREIKMPDNTLLVQIQPDLSGRPMGVIRAITNFAFYLGYDPDGGRVITVRHAGSDIWFKCCTDEAHPRFFDPDGNPVHKISGGTSPQQSWDNLMKSWNNELYDVDYVDPTKTLKKNRKNTA